MAFVLADLPYAYDALEPVIDAETMKLHHDKHHQTYTTKLNEAIAGTEWEEKSIEELLQSLPLLPDDIRDAVRNHGGGFYNHNLFWSIMAPGGKPMSATMEKMIKESFGSVSVFEDSFKAAALKQFGSGRARLVKDSSGLEVMMTPNQDSPLAKGKTPILGIDVWEHAYYLKYQNKRPDYVAAFMTIINREKVEELAS